jgi:hypothetical protein
MYNLLFGQNPQAKLILAILGLTKADIGRFRDAFVGEGKIAIYTRLGGGNRECYCDSTKEHEAGGCYQKNIEKLQAHPNYLSDVDDYLDRTYATFYFSFPEKYAEILKAMDRGTFDADKRWEDKLQEIATLPAGEIGRKYPEICAIIDAITRWANEPSKENKDV